MTAGRGRLHYRVNIRRRATPRRRPKCRAGRDGLGRRFRAEGPEEEVVGQTGGARGTSAARRRCRRRRLIAIRLDSRLIWHQQHAVQILLQSSRREYARRTNLRQRMHPQPLASILNVDPFSIPTTSNINTDQQFANADSLLPLGKHTAQKSQQMVLLTQLKTSGTSAWKRPCSQADGLRCPISPLNVEILVSRKPRAVRPGSPGILRVSARLQPLKLVRLPGA